MEAAEGEGANPALFSYEAGSVSREQADAILADANRFVSAVASMLGA
jgi:hypothetical protein